MKIYLNGQLVGKEQAVVSVFDHGLLYGDGVFEGIRVYGGNVFLLKDHIERLYESREGDPSGDSNLAARHDPSHERDGRGERNHRRLRPAGRDSRRGSLGLDIRRTSNPQIIIIADTITLYPAEIYENGMHLITASTIRNHPAALPARIKSLNYLNNILAKIEGTDAGTVER